jgi:regulator of RNase E activity RraA
MSRLIAGGPTLRPMHKGGVLSGPAFTVRTRPGDNLMIHKALQLGRPGDVLVIDGGGALDRGLFGEIMKRVAQSRGFAGLVIDGAIRDVSAYRADTWPAYARGVCHRGPYKDGPGEINVPVSIANMVVNPGDIVLGDDDGLAFVTPAEAAAVAAASRAKLADEQATFRAIADGSYDDSWIDQTLRARKVID